MSKPLVSQRVRAFDSPRWCDHCAGWGEHHTDRHNLAEPSGQEEPGEGPSAPKPNANIKGPGAVLSGHSDSPTERTA